MPACVCLSNMVFAFVCVSVCLCVQVTSPYVFNERAFFCYSFMFFLDVLFMFPILSRSAREVHATFTCEAAPPFNKGGCVCRLGPGMFAVWVESFPLLLFLTSSPLLTIRFLLLHSFVLYLRVCALCLY